MSNEIRTPLKVTLTIDNASGDREIDAIQLLILALDSLEPEAKWRVLDYVTRRTRSDTYGFENVANAHPTKGE